MIRVKRFYEFLNESEKLSKPPIKIIFAGNIIKHQDPRSKVTDFSKVFQEVKFLFESADFVLCNLETLFPGNFAKISKNNQIEFSAPDDFAKALKDAGITHLCLTNNHIMQHGIAGYQRTLDILDKTGIISITQSKIFEVKDYKFEVYSFTTEINENLPDDFKEDFTTMYKPAITGLDFNIVMPHWAGSYIHHRSKKYLSIAQHLSRMGYEYVMGCGHHKPQKTIVEGNSVIAYSLGDLLSANITENSKSQGKIISVEISSQGIQNLREYQIKTQKENENLIIQLLDVNEIL